MPDNTIYWGIISIVERFYMHQDRGDFCRSRQESSLPARSRQKESCLTGIWRVCY